jgi:hypothetical protein
MKVIAPKAPKTAYWRSTSTPAAAVTVQPSAHNSGMAAAHTPVGIQFWGQSKAGRCERHTVRMEIAWRGGAQLLGPAVAGKMSGQLNVEDNTIAAAANATAPTTNNPPVAQRSPRPVLTDAACMVTPASLRAPYAAGACTRAPSESAAQ